MVEKALDSFLPITPISNRSKYRGCWNEDSLDALNFDCAGSRKFLKLQIGSM